MKGSLLVLLLLIGCSSDRTDKYETLSQGPLSNYQKIQIDGDRFEITRHTDVQMRVNGKMLTKNKESGTVIYSQGFLILSYNDFKVEKLKCVEMNGNHYLMDDLAYEIWEKTGKITEHGQTLIKTKKVLGALQSYTK